MYPEAISNDKGSGVMEIRWQDGTLQKLGNGFLRTNCQCASCKASRHNGGMLSVAPNVRIVDIIQVGSYAVQLVFSDGHQRGIFPWAYLRNLPV
jgi:DUF971 family protein